MPPKLKMGAAEAGAEVAGASVLGAAPNSGLEGAAEAPPNRFELVVVLLAPNNGAAVVDAAGSAAAGSVAVCFVGSAGLAPKSVEDCITGVDSPVLLASPPNRLEAAGLAAGAPNRLEAGLAGSAGLSVPAGLAPNRPLELAEPVGLNSNAGFFAGCESFSLSDSSPSLPVPAAGAAGLSEAGLAAPKRLEGAVLLGAKMPPVGVDSAAGVAGLSEADAWEPPNKLEAAGLAPPNRPEGVAD